MALVLTEFPFACNLKAAIQIPNMIKLYSYFRSSSSYRVRIALNLKSLDFETIPIHLLKNGGEQFSQDFKQKNQASKIPVLVDGSKVLAQSVAILEYLEEVYLNHPLYPEDSFDKALVRQLCEIINSDIQPLQNLAVLKRLVSTHQFSETEKIQWIKDWITLGFKSFESLVEQTHDQFCFGQKPGAADCFLIPQVYNANRFEVDMSQFPLISQITENCLKLEAFKKAHPDNQPDSPTKL